MELKLNSENFEKEVLNSNNPVLVDFYADWCGPCKMMGPVVEKAAETYEGKLKVGKVNVDDNPELAQKYRITSIPAFVGIKNGEVVLSRVGAMSSGDFASVCDSLL